MAFRWRADDGPLKVIFVASFPSSTKKYCQVWTPSDTTFWIRACICYWFYSIVSDKQIAIFFLSFGQWPILDRSLIWISVFKTNVSLGDVGYVAPVSVYTPVSHVRVYVETNGCSPNRKFTLFQIFSHLAFVKKQITGLMLWATSPLSKPTS